MKGFITIAFLSLAVLALGQGCNCGKPPDTTPDAGLCAGPSTCLGDCPSGCVGAETCDPATGWQCACACTVNTTNLCDEYAKRACDFFIRCHAEQSLFFDATEGRGPSLPAYSTNQVAASERARCEAAVASAGSCAQVLESFKGNRTRFDPEAYSACQASLYPADSCARDLNTIQELCLKKSFVAANASQGQPCQSDGECTNGWCDAQGSSCGVCQPYVPVSNGSCARNTQCDPAVSYCSTNSQTCLPFRTLNQSCSLTEFTSCGPNLQCVIANIFGISGTCQAGIAEGQKCTQNRYACLRSNRALPELVCAPNPGASGNVCQKLQSPPGGACGNGELVVPDFNSPTGGTRGPLCPDTQYCSINVCVPKKAADSACATDEQCAPSLRCIDSGSGSRSCQPFADTGAACSGTADCKNLLACGGDSKCVGDLALPGQPCPSGVACASGWCDNSRAAPACADWKAAGAGCAGKAECRSDVCDVTCQRACWQAL